MVIQKQKAFEEILKSLEGEQKVFIAGCADCATTCRVGGEDQLVEMKVKLEEAGKTVTGSYVFDTACLRGEVRDKGKEYAAAIQGADSVLVLACGSGAQTIGDELGVPVHPGADSLFIGEVVRLGKYVEKCSACGQCILEYTDGICPVTRCSKGLLNGPCGGSNNGKCEVDPEKDCAWALIFDRLKERGHLDKMRGYLEPKDNTKRITPGQHEWPKKRPPKKEKAAANN